MKQNYQYCLTNLLKDEGGYTNNPNDKGGPTNFGITITDYRLYINPQGTAQDVKNMTVEQAKLIYKTKYWDKLKCNDLPSGVDYTVFDYGVLSGVSRSQAVYGKFKSLDPKSCIKAIHDERMAFYKGIRGGKDWKVFGKGWATRLDNVQQKSIALATNPPKTGSVLTGTVAGGAATVAAKHWWTPIVNHWEVILAGSLVAGVFAFVIYSIFEYRKNKKA